MDCKYAEKLMMKYMDGEITEKEAEELNRHILQCEKCREEFYVYDNMMKEAQMLSEEEITAPEGFEKAVMSRIKSEREVVYGYNKGDKIRVACVSVFAVLFVLSNVIVSRQHQIIEYFYRYPAFREHFEGVMPFARVMEGASLKMYDMLVQVVQRADEILSSMTAGIAGLIVVFCVIQAVMCVKRNKHQ